MCGEVSIKISRVAKANKFNGNFPGVNIHPIFLCQANRYLAVYAQYGIIA